MMLRKTEAFQLLARREYTAFSQSGIHKCESRAGKPHHPVRTLQILANSATGLSCQLNPGLSQYPLSDAELLKIAKSAMVKTKQRRLERLADLQKQRQLTEAEQAELQHLFDEGQRVMLRKAEAFRLLARRGYTVFSQSGKLAI